jgi:beta-lactamase class A
MAAFTQGMRLVILGVGVWAIIGTALSVWDPATRSVQSSQAADDGVSQESTPSSDLTHATHLVSRLQFGQEMSSLATRTTPLTQAMSDLVPGVFVMDLDNGDYYSLNGEASFPAASMIKVPILVAFFQDVDTGKVYLNEVLSLQQVDLAGGSGEMQYAEVGTQYSALETVTNMIINSDNTATNMIIRRLGGIEALNQRFREWGLQQTVMHNLLPDLEGTNTLSPKELSTLIARVSEGELVSLKSRDRLFDIMQRTVNNSLLPSALGEGASIAHKTGDIGSLAGDAGLVDMPNGKRYTISAMVKRPHNDARAYELVVQIGGAVYEYLNQSAHSPAVTGNPASYPSTPTPTTSPATVPAVGSGTSR